jgi:hypothetical protein
MKKILFLLSAAVLSTVLLGFFNPSRFIKHKAEASVGEGDDVDDYYKWEQQRLADPETGKIPANIRSYELAYAATLPNDMSLAYDRTLSTGWAARGPWNVGGRTRSFAADVNNEAILLAGTTSGGMWRSADSGKSWTLTTPLSVEQGVACATQDTRAGHTNVWYYGTGEAYGASASASGAYFLGTGIYRSTDDGQTWTSLPATYFNSDNFVSFWQASWSMAADPKRMDSSLLYVSTIGALFRSADSGNTWKTVLGGSMTSYSYYTDVKVSDSGVVYATMSSDGPQKGIWRSTDGLNFTNIMPAGFPAAYNRMVIGISPDDPTQVYILANTPGYGMVDTNFLGQLEWNSLWKYKYLSGNGSGAGGIWYNLTANLPSRGGYFDKYNCQGSYDMVVRFLPGDTATVFIGGTDIFRSTTGFFDTMHTAHIGGYMIGASLPSVKVYPGHHPDQHVLFFSKNNPLVMYSGCDGGIYRTNNDTAISVSWTTLNNGYETTMFYTAASDHTRPGGRVLIGGAQDNNSLFDNSVLQTNPWTKPIFGDGSFCYIEDTGKVFYYSSQQGKMFKGQMDTTTGTLTAFRRIDPIGGKNYEFVNPYVVDPNNNNIMYLAGGKYLWRNDSLSKIPFSNQWDSITTGWTEYTDSVPRVNSYITAVAVSKVPANRVYYGTDYQKLYRVDNANVGTPTPKDITGTTPPNYFPNGYISSIAVDPANADHVMVTFSNYGVQNIFYSADGGTTWTRVSGNLYKIPSIRWAAMQHLTGGKMIYWIGASTGLYATDTLLGTSTVWVQQGTSTIGNAVCDMVDVRDTDGLVAVATHAHGIYTATITSVNSIATVHNIDPVVQGLQVNVYPNPFAETASISFNLPKDANVVAGIYDMEGKLVKQYNENNMSSGQHIISFDAQGQPAGVYFCRLQAGNDVKTVRMVIVK